MGMFRGGIVQNCCANPVFTLYQISDLWVTDEGTYTCEAENQFGKIVSRPAMLTVTGLGN